MLTKPTYTGNRLGVDRGGRREGSTFVPISLGVACFETGGGSNTERLKGQLCLKWLLYKNRAKNLQVVFFLNICFLMCMSVLPAWMCVACIPGTCGDQ